MFVNSNQGNQENGDDFQLDQIINDIDTIRKNKRGQYLTTTKRKILREMLLDKT